ncbi:MAG: hypothetical protein WC882_02170 [Candidatus Gracilibacteria bacterium]
MAEIQESPSAAPSSPPPPPLSKEEIGQYLRVGYLAMLLTHWPLNKNIGHCLTEGQAYLFQQERDVHGPLVQELSYENLSLLIPPIHQARMQTMWEAVKEQQKKSDETTLTLEDTWERAPKITDRKSESFVERSPLPIKKTSRKVARAYIAPTPSIPTMPSREKDLVMWRTREGTERRGLYETDKIYLDALEAYLIMLLERPPSDPTDLLDIPPLVITDETTRQKAARLLGEVKAVKLQHLGFSAVKTETHAQRKMKLRKSTKAPYIIHPWRAALAHHLYIASHDLEETSPESGNEVGMTIDTIINEIAILIHDLGEDTALAIQEVVKETRRITGGINAKIIQRIRTGFPSRRDVHDNGRDRLIPQIELVCETIQNRLFHILLALTDGAEKTMFPGYKRKALDQSVAGERLTREIIGEPEENEGEEKQPTLQAFSKFPIPDPDHTKGPSTMQSFLVRALALAKDNTELEGMLLGKIFDRCDNLSDHFEDKEIESQLRNLRETAGCLIVYLIEDYIPTHPDHKLYGAPALLIDRTLEEYTRLQKEGRPPSLTAIDTQYIAYLREIKDIAPRPPLPPRAQKAVNEFNEARTRPRNGKHHKTTPPLAA